MGTLFARMSLPGFFLCHLQLWKLNRRVVFKDEQSRKTSFWRYAVLAATILTLNTLILSFFVYVLGMNAIAAKILTESCCSSSLGAYENIRISQPYERIC